MSTPIVTPSVANAPSSSQTPAPAQKPNQAQPAQAVTPSPSVEPPKKEDAFSPRFAALSRQEKALRAEQAALKAQREAQEREWAPKIEQARRVEELRAKAKTDRATALELMKEFGLTYDELTKLHMNGGKQTPEMVAEEARREVEALRREQKEREEKTQADLKAEAEAKQKAHVDNSIKAFKGQIGEFLNTKPDDFELTLNHPEGIDLIYQVIEAHYDQTEKEEGTGRVMGHEEAAQAVEAYLEKDYEEKVLSRKKIQAKLGKRDGSPAEPSSPEGRGNSGSQSGGAQAHDSGAASAVPAGNRSSLSPRTLTNQDQTTVSTPTRSQPKSREESIAEAAKLIRWQ